MQTNTNKPALFLKVVGKITGRSTLFVKLDYLFPECQFLINDLPKMSPLICFRENGCPRNRNCIETLHKRVNCILDTFTDVDHLILYFKYRDRPGSQRAVLFYRDERDPKYFVLNRCSWDKFKHVGTIYEWVLPNELFLSAKIS